MNPYLRPFIFLAALLTLAAAQAQANEGSQIDDKEMLASMHEGCMQGMKEVKLFEKPDDVKRYCDCNTREMGKHFTMMEIVQAGMSQKSTPEFDAKAEKIAETCIGEITPH